MLLPPWSFPKSILSGDARWYRASFGSVINTRISIAYLSKTQWFHWHFSHQTDIAQYTFICFFFYSAFSLMSVKIRIVCTKNSYLLISTVTWLWVNTFPVEYSKTVSVLYSIICVVFHKQRNLLCLERVIVHSPYAENKDPVASASHSCLWVCQEAHKTLCTTESEMNLCSR